MSEDRQSTVDDEQSILGAAFLVKQGRAVGQVILMAALIILWPLFSLHPEYFRGSYSGRGSWINIVLGSMSESERLLTYVLVELWSLYTLVFQIARPYFTNQSLAVIMEHDVQGFDKWGAVKAVPSDSIYRYTVSKPLIKIYSKHNRLRVPLAALDISRKEVDALVVTLDRIMKRKSAI